MAPNHFVFFVARLQISNGSFESCSFGICLRVRGEGAAGVPLSCSARAFHQFFPSLRDVDEVEAANITEPVPELRNPQVRNTSTVRPQDPTGLHHPHPRHPTAVSQHDNMFGSVSRAVTVFAGLATTFLGIVVAKRHHPNEISDLSELKTQVDENLRLNVDAQTQFYWRDDDPKTNPAFNQTTHRWSARNSPQFDLVVHVMREVDVGAVVSTLVPFICSWLMVLEQVRFANGLDRPFLAITGGHGTSRNLGFVRGGIGIWMQSLNSIIIDDVKAKKGSMTAVTVQGGTMVGDLRRALLEKGYMTGKPDR